MAQITYGLSYGTPCKDVPSIDWDELDYSEPPDVEMESEVPFVGYHIAAGASGIRGLPDLLPFQIGGGDADDRYADATERAVAKWNDFAAFMAARGVVLPVPEIWIVQMEVA